MKKILVVNNDFDTMILLKSWLEKKTYDVKFTGNQDEIDDIVKQFKPELVLVDVLQKTAIEKVKTGKHSGDIPVLLMTGYTLREQHTNVQADDFIEKPFNLPLLEMKIEKLIKGSKAYS